MDYQTLIDAPTWAFISKTNAHYPPETASYSIDRQRQIYTVMCREFFRGYPAGVTAQNETIAGVPCRRYWADTIIAGPATILYLHGGGFVVGGLDSHDDICAEINASTGLTVVSADYRLSPEHLHPAAFDDACAVARALPGPLVLVGDSAGANLAAAAAHALRGSPVRILGQVLIYPGLGGDLNTGSYLAHAQAPMLTREDVLFYKDIRHAAAAPAHDPTVSPLTDPDFARLPPTLTISAECDPLADDARTYADKITAAGGRAHWSNGKGLVHGFLRARSTVPRAAAQFAQVTSTLSAFAKGDWPFKEPT